MKKLAFLLLIVTTSVALNASPQQTPESFDASMELFSDALASGNLGLAEQFFADSMAYERDDGRIVHVPRELVFSDLEADLGESMSAQKFLLVMTKGFEAHGDLASPFFVNTHSGLHQPELISIKAGAVNFRKLPSTESPVICLLEKGVYSGNRDLTRPLFTDAETGIEWTPLRVFHPSIGSVKGYVASSLVTIQNKHVPREMKVEFIDGKWTIVSLTLPTNAMCAM